MKFPFNFLTVVSVSWLRECSAFVAHALVLSRAGYSARQRVHGHCMRVSAVTSVIVIAHFLCIPSCDACTNPALFSFYLFIILSIPL